MTISGQFGQSQYKLESLLVFHSVGASNNYWIPMKYTNTYSDKQLYAYILSSLICCDINAIYEFLDESAIYSIKSSLSLRVEEEELVV